MIWVGMLLKSPKGPELIVLIWMCPTMAQTRPTAWSILTTTFFGWCPKKTDILSDKYTNILPDILSCHLFEILTRHFGWHSVRVGGQRACELAILFGSGEAQRAGELAIEWRCRHSWQGSWGWHAGEAQGSAGSPGVPEEHTQFSEPHSFVLWNRLACPDSGWSCWGPLEHMVV